MYRKYNDEFNLLYIISIVCFNELMGNKKNWINKDNFLFINNY